MRTPALRIHILTAVVLTALALTDARSQVISTFDSDLEGWLIIGDNAGTWQGAGGNPGGYMDVNDLVTGQLNRASAPPAFLGDWSTMTAADTLAFDVYLELLSGSTITGDWIFRIAGPGGAAQGIVPGPAPPQGVWSTFAVAMDSASWTIESGSWSAILSNVTSLKLLVEYVNGGEEVRVDNVRLSTSPVPVFEPCVYSDFNGAGLDDWSFDGTGSASNPENGEGNGGGFLRVADNTSTPGFALAPSRFLGDWSQLDGNGWIRVDLRVESFSGSSEGSPEFIRLTGPGGSAYVSLDPSEVPTSNREWRTFTFALSSTVWTVDSGTWAGLLSFVEEWRIDTDFFDGGETVGLDNVGRLRGDCPPIDDGVTAYTRDHCATLSLIGVNGIAVSPYDGVLHGLVRGDGSRDGVYTLTGTAAYTKLQSYSNPAGLVFDDDGDGFVSEDFGGNVYRFVGAESSMVWVSGFHSGDDDPFGMDLAPPGFNGPNVSAGDILVADRGNSGADQIWSFSPDVPEGEQLVTPDPGSVDWFDIATAPDGTVWLCDALQSDSLYVLSPDGTLAGAALSAPIPGPVSIASDPADTSLYVGSNQEAVYQVDPATGAVTLVADGFAQLGLAAVEVGFSARRLWVSDRGTNRVYEFCLPTVTAAGDTRPPRRGGAMRAFPNPFNPSVHLSFDLERAGHTTLRVYDVAGRLVRTVAARPMTAGTHTLHWDGRGDAGARVASGVYFARLQQGGAVAVTRLVLVR